MTDTDRDITPAMATERPRHDHDRSRDWQKIRSTLAFRNISAVYMGIAIIVVFGVWVPETFLTTTTLTSILAQQAAPLLISLGLLVPIAADAFDLTIGFVAGLAATFFAWAVVFEGWPVVLAVVVALVIALTVGLINGLLVVKVGISSLIATLAVGSIVSALTVWISNNIDIGGFPPYFLALHSTRIAGVALSVYFVLLVAVALWFFLEHTPTGRYIYATGGNPVAAALAGVRTRRYVMLAFLMSAGLSGLGGLVSAAQIGAASPTLAPTFLLPAFAAVFLGATQFKQGRPNVWGTVVAILVLATGSAGLNLVGGPFWTKDIFYGMFLLVAVGISVSQGNRQLSRMIRRAGRRSAQS